MSISQAVVEKLRESLARELSGNYSHLPLHMQDSLVSKVLAEVQPVLEAKIESATNEASSEAPFRFLDLHPELRNRIYEFALDDHKNTSVHVIHRTCRSPLTGQGAKAVWSLATGMALLQVCRQMRKEASGYFYAGNTFVANSGSAKALGYQERGLHRAIARAKGWLEFIGKENA